MIKNRRKFLIVAAAAFMLIALTGCMNAGNRPLATPIVTLPPMPTVVPEITTQPTPMVSPMPTEQAGQQGGQTTGQPTTNAEPMDWSKDAQKVADRIKMISEISEAHVMVIGDTALVGVEFANQYKGELTQRIREMVAQQVLAADANIRNVAVTAEKEDVNNIRDFMQNIVNGQDAKQFKDDFDRILRNTTTLR